MSQEGRRVCLAVGVGGANPRKYLSGARNDARRFGSWATAAGFETAILLDEDHAPVTVASYRAALEHVLWPTRAADLAEDSAAQPEPIEWLILYFAGHGMLKDAGETLWLLSDWESDERAVAVSPLTRKLYRYPIEQLTVISDACSDLPRTVVQLDITADGVLGKGPSPSHEPWLDVFKASQDGTTTFMVPFDNPDDDRCIFTSTLLEGLWGEALASHPPDAVTGGSLAVFVKERLPGLSRRYSGEARNPSVHAGIPGDKGIYFRKPPGFAPPSFPPWPDRAAVKDMGLGRPTAGPSAPASRTSMREALVERLSMIARKSHSYFAPETPPPPDPRTSLAMLTGGIPPSSGGALGVAGARASRLRGFPGTNVDAVPAQGWWRFDLAPDTSTPLLVDLEDGGTGTVAAAVAANGFATMIAAGAEQGVLGMVLQSAVDQPNPATIQAIAAMEERGASLAPSEAIALATHARQGKHADPVLGVISAYLYDAIGDTESIRRMAWFYAQRGQPIPYDIALLGMLRGRVERGQAELSVYIDPVAARDPRTPEEAAHDWTHCETYGGEATVAGRWPWMRQGWAFLEDPTDEEWTLIDPVLLEVGRKHLTGARFTTVTPAGADLLAEAFGLDTLWVAEGAALGA